MSPYEIYVAGYYLAEYPPGFKDMRFDTLCQMILDDDDNIIIWEPFEHSDREWLVTLMHSMVDSLQGTFIPREAK